MHLHHDHNAPSNLFDAHVVLRLSAIVRPKSERVAICDALNRLGSKMKPGEPDRAAAIRATFRVPAQPDGSDPKQGEAAE